MLKPFLPRPQTHRIQVQRMAADCARATFRGKQGGWIAQRVAGVSIVSVSTSAAKAGYLFHLIPQLLLGRMSWLIGVWYIHVPSDKALTLSSYRLVLGPSSLVSVGGKAWPYSLWQRLSPCLPLPLLKPNGPSSLALC
jgi:hypothetical protein